MSAKNKVIAGDNKGLAVSIDKTKLKIGEFSYSIKEYEEQIGDNQKVKKEGVGKRIIKNVFLGRSKLPLDIKKEEIHIIAIEYGNEKLSLIEVDDEIFKVIEVSCN